MRDKKVTMKQILNFINGEYQATGRSFDKRSPLNGTIKVFGIIFTAL